MFGSMSATMVGVTFPVTSMPPIIDMLSNLFPARHFTLVSQNLCYENLGIIHLWKHYLILILFLILPIISMFKLFSNKLLISNTVQTFEFNDEGIALEQTSQGVVNKDDEKDIKTYMANIESRV